MKNARILFLIAALFLISLPVEAQLNRNVGKSYNTPKKKKNNVDYLELSVQLLADNLTLDTFQEAVVKDILKSSQVEQEKIILLDIPNESKNEEILAVRESVNIKIIAILNSEQIAKYEEMKKKGKKK